MPQTTEKKLKICVVDINPVVPATPEQAQQRTRFYVRHYDPRQARAWALEQAVTSRVAEQDEVLQMGRQGISPIGPFEGVPADDQDDLPGLDP